MSLKAYKEAVKVGGRMRVLAHWIAECVGDVRVIDKVQGNSFRYRVDGRNKPDGSPEPFWSPFPKASELEFDGKVARVKLVGGEKFWEMEIL